MTQSCAHYAGMWMDWRVLGAWLRRQMRASIQPCWCRCHQHNSSQGIEDVGVPRHRIPRRLR